MLDTIKKIKWKHYINYIGIGLVLLIYTIISLTTGLEKSTLINLEKISISIMLAVSLSLVIGFLGELSLGHAGFMCIGAYVGGKISALLMESNNVPNLLVFIISILVGGISAMIAGIIVGLPALRLKGDYLAIVTLAFGEIVRSLFLNSSEESFGGPQGLNTPRYDRNTLFILAFLLILFMLFVIQNLIRSKHGRAITAIRDSEIAAKATGINVTFYKLFVFALAAFFAGIAGTIYSFSQYTIQSSKFNYNYSIEILVMVVLGGMGNITGSIISAVLITLLQNKLPIILGGDYAVLQNVLYALILVLIVIYNNAPVFKTFRETYNLKKLMQKLFKKINDPSYHKDDEAKWDRVPTKIEMNEILSVDLQPEVSVKDPDEVRGDINE